MTMWLIGATLALIIALFLIVFKWENTRDSDWMITAIILAVVATILSWLSVFIVSIVFIAMKVKNKLKQQKEKE